MTTTTDGRTARDLALEGLTLQQQLKIMQWAEMHNIPPDDSIYWLAVILRPDLNASHEADWIEPQIAQQVEQGFGLMAQTMEHFNDRLEQIESVFVAQPDPEIVPPAAAIPTPRCWLAPLALSIAGTAIGIVTFVWGYQSAQPTSTAAPATVEQSRPAAGIDQRLLDPSLDQANQDRLKRCWADGNDKCTLLIRPPS